MRTIVLAIALAASGCAHTISSDTGTERVNLCGELDDCAGGTGEADGVVAVAVVGTIIGVFAVAAYRHWLAR